MIIDLSEEVAKKKPLEDMFDDQLKEAGISSYKRNVPFIPKRRFSADFWFEDLNLVVEIDGGIFMRGPSGHTSGQGYHNDRVRDHLALSHGIHTIRFTTPQVKSGEAIGFLKAYLPHRRVEVRESKTEMNFRSDLPKDYGKSTSGKKKKKSSGSR